LNKKDIGKRIQLARNQSHYTQEALAEKLEISLTHMCALENGYSGPSLSMLMKLATTLQVSLDWIVFGIAENPNTEIYRVLADCSEEELRIFTLVIKSLKSGLRSDQL